MHALPLARFAQAVSASARLLPPEGSGASRAGRLAATILVEVIAFVLVTLLFPLLLLGAAGADLFLWVRERKPWVGVRLVAVLWWFLAGELRGLAGLFLAWLVSGPWKGDTPARRRRVFRLQATWAAGHLWGIRRIFGLHWEIEGDELVRSDPDRPILVLIRHASIVDNALPATVISLPHRMRLRFIIKHELQALPTLNIGGHWIPTCFVRRESDNPDRQVARVRTLGEHLGPGDGVLIYPEGTRFTPGKLARAQAKIAEHDPAVAVYADQLRHLLPPRLGGPLALLDEATGADIVVCGHVGFDGFERVSDVWRGGLVGAAITVRFWRFSRAEVPATQEERIVWIYQRWLEMDRWIEEQHRPSGGASSPDIDDEVPLVVPA